MIECRKTLGTLTQTTSLNPCVIKEHFDCEVVFIAKEDITAMDDNHLSLKENEKVKGELIIKRYC